MDEALKLISALADKIGQTTGSLFPYFVRYQRINGLVSIFGWATCFIGGYFITMACINSKRLADDGMPVLIRGSIGLLISAIFLALLCGATTDITKFLEPTGSAINSIIIEAHSK